MLRALPGIELRPLSAAVPAQCAELDAAGWRIACETLARSGARLGALWASDERDRQGGFVVHLLAVAYGELLELRLAVAETQPGFPDVADLFPCAARMQRAVADLYGLRALSTSGELRDARGWLRHGAWRDDAFPLRRDVAPEVALAAGDDRYAFVTVEGEGVHEIAVGPVHAGTIEPGHFRFSVVGERVLRLEERLGYKHKGVEKRFESMSQADGARLAARVSGDSSVAYGWAYAMALEAAAGSQPSARAQWLRALLLERERLASHLGDLGHLGNDAGFAFGLAQFSRLREDLLRSNARVFGHRYLMDCIVPGGVACEPDARAAAQLIEEADGLEAEIRRLRTIYDDHAGLQDRFIACGRLTPRTAAALGVVGLAARASGHAMDARVHPGFAPYAELAPRIAARRNGDVAARVDVRFDEALESLRLERLILRSLPPGAALTKVPAAPAGAYGLGWIEGWRGEVFVALEAGPAGGIRRCHPHDPSWQNWPALEHAIMGNIVPDFPLINKSFNLSYAGVDL